ncbi:MAG: HD domain-containing protein [Bacillota bacterium]|nr:HD domain-containing protein [Candidatus Fermentithermobacillaceae bacterium]HAF67300.1 phosphohydrolase [Clostridiales bacterium UBA9857]HOA70396.1 HD domain-containing protein [Bacillota bacterium]HOP70640.1 HD domain-containing protein [Bacillota bacterium]HPT35468.1 HD domain-containing protein [Bacillota bacterium]
MKSNRLVTLEDVRANPVVEAYIKAGNEHLGALGFTDHGLRHSGLVANIAKNLLNKLGFSEREQELAAIAGYLHDIGNVVSRYYHAQVGAALAERILSDMGMDPAEIAVIMGAIGSHDPEDTCQAVSNVSAAVILADKSDVHRSRVRNPDIHNFDVHDRVNYAATRSFLEVKNAEKVISLQLTIDTKIAPVMEYFEIFLTRMVACKRAAEFLGATFELSINDVKLL